MKWFGIATVVLVLTAPGFKAETSSPVTQSINFSRQIRPILSENCFACHGPDEEQRKAKLRLDTREGALAEKDGVAIIKPGDSSHSELLKRILSSDPDEKMPPAKTGKSLTPEQVALLKQWIDSGANWETHWAFEKPVRPELPKVKNAQWPKNQIDYFILDKLEHEGLSPSQEADKPTLARRATLDATGLPPTIEEVDALLADNNPEAYEGMVDRLINSSRYGEQMARYWLDTARYADSHGYHIDAPRMVWKYREWVIDAFNKNLPFDQFTIDQIAGDMLPNATLEQKVASGFNRCNMSTGEGGAIEEEYRVKYAADRVETVGTTWMGLTIGCARCHTHKFDPITHKEFYQMAAFFNGIAEAALDGNAPAPAPAIKVPDKEQMAEQERLNKAIAALKEQVEGPNPELDAAEEKWRKQWAASLRTEFQTVTPKNLKSTGGATFKTLEDGSVLVEGPNPDKDVYEITLNVGPGEYGALRLEALTDDSLPHKGAARSDNGNFVLTEFQAQAGSLAEPSRLERVKIYSAVADFAQDKFPINLAIDGNKETGWAIQGYEKRENRTASFLFDRPVAFNGGAQFKIKLGFESIFAKHSIGRFRISLARESEGLASLRAPSLSPWQMAGPFAAPSGDEAYKTDFGPEKRVDLTQTYADGKISWSAKPEFKDGQVHPLSGENTATYLYRAIRSPESRKAVLSLGSDDSIKVWLNGTLVHENPAQRGAAPDQDRVTIDLREGENELLVKIVNFSLGGAFYFNLLPADGSIPADLAQMFALNEGKLSQQNLATLRKYYRENFSPGWKELSSRLAQERDALKKLEATIPVTMISQELEKPRDTFVLIRGEYDKHGEKVSPDVPAALPPMKAGEKHDRLALAKWLVDRENPLTARVVVNRFWQRYFGTGLVKTAEDFGAQGDAPSHPELLDWLAVEFIESGWDVKHIQRLILTSATYRQSSKITPELYKRDPDNRLLARGPRFRMDAEMLRDSALAVSGLLVEKIGGPSVKPYQPPGLWTEVSYGFKEDYVADHGPGLYRRSLYTYWKRQSPPPGMTTFDAPSREVCTVRRPRTNTPLQALALMNDPQYVEASRALALRLLTECDSDPAEKIRFGIRLATGRIPSESDVHILREAFNKQLAEFKAAPESATKLLSVGEFTSEAPLDKAEWAAWTSIASIILNLDATVTKS